MPREDLLKKILAKHELERRRREEALRYYRPHAKQRIVHKSEKRLKMISGGNRVGKSHAGAVEDVLEALGRDAEPYIQSWDDEDKEWWYRRFYPIKGHRRIWVATENWDVQREVIQEKIRSLIPKPILDRCDIAWRKKGVMDYISFPNGSRITFKSYETGADGFQGASLDLVHLDEEPDMQIWQECEKRVLDRKGRILLTMTPLKGLTYIYSRVYTNTTDPEILVVEISWDDNPYLDEGEKRRLLANMSEDEIAARVYGKFLVGGQSIFNASILNARRNEVQPGKPFDFDPAAAKFVPARDRRAVLEVWEEPKPGHRYVIGVDTAEGLPHGDNSVACVLDARSGRQVAELVCKEEPSAFARMVCALGRWYNDAFIVVERNKDGLAVLSRLDEDFLYPRLYVHDDDQRFGWPNNAKTRPLLIAKGQEMVRDAADTIASRALIEEMLTFVRNKVGRPEAAGKGKPGGMKDDRVFAWMLAVWGREYADVGVMPPVLPGKPAHPRTPWADEDADDPKGEYARWDPRFYATFSSSSRR